MSPLEEYLQETMLSDPFYHRCREQEFEEVDSSMFEFLACRCFDREPCEGLRLAKEKCAALYAEYEREMRLRGMH